VIAWKPADPATGKPGAWEGDVPDGPAPPLANEKDGKLPFIMKPLGVGSIFGSGLATARSRSTTSPWRARSRGT